jgi:predicted RNA-binding Zn-ribbon protein involved in translation (DUF1610 family)
MALFDGRHQAEQDVSEDEAVEASQPSAPELLRSALSSVGRSVGANWLTLAETALIGCGAVVLSVLFIWATVTGRVSVEAIVVILVMLILTLFAVGQGMTYHTRNLAIQERARESVTKTTMAAEIMMEFLRDFTLKNQETISRLAENYKVRIVDELGKVVDDLLKSTGDQGMHRELAQLKAIIARKVMDIPTGVALPLPRLEQFDHALRHLQEAERIPKCPACGAAQARISRIDSVNGIQYACSRCGHEFSVGITVMLEQDP